eukprot:232776_1
MAQALQSTSSGVAPTEEGDLSDMNEQSIDYVELLRVVLRQQKLIYIADIMEQVGVPLNDLFEWTISDILEASRDIHNNNQNQHQIRMLDRNKFAKTVIGIAKKRKDTMKKTTESQLQSTTNVKILIIGKEEEEAIEAIQNGEQYMNELVNKMEKSLNGLHANTK